jgi:Fe-Mn family superoxide dismutase
MELCDLVTSASGDIFNNAAQVWNHTFYWNSMAPGGGSDPSDRIGRAIAKSFGSMAAFRKEFIASAVGLFGSGYVWLTFDPERECVGIERMEEAENPLRVGRVPLRGMDVWEHAYYLDYQNERHRYVDAFLSHLANWRFAEANLEACHQQGAS